MWNAGKVRKEKNGPVLPRLWRSKQSPGALISLTLVPINASENEASSDSPAPSGASSFKFRIGTSGKSDEMQSMRNWLREGKLGENTNDSNRSVETMISPLITYLRLFGLINKTKTTWLRKPLLVYNVLVLTFLITLTMLIGMMKVISASVTSFVILRRRLKNYHTIQNFFFLSNYGLTVRFAFTIVNLLFLTSGGLSACFLFIIQKRLDELIAFVIKQISVIDTNFYYAKRVRHVCKMMVTFVFLGSCITVLFNSILYIEIRDKRYAGTAFQAYYLLVDYYVVFMAQTALISSTIFYALLNYILAQCLDKFIEDMRRSGILLDDKTTCENAISCLESLQNRYEILKKAADVIENNFKYIVFYVQTVCLIELCCLLYAYLQNPDGRERDWYDTIQFTAFLSQIIFYMMSFILPPCFNLEKNKNIAEICPEMFEKQMRRTSNVMLSSKVLLFMYHLERMPITFTSGGFFVVRRSLLLTLISFTLTYVLLMLQLGQTPGCMSNLFQKLLANTTNIALVKMNDTIVF